MTGDREKNLSQSIQNKQITPAMLEKHVENKPNVIWSRADRKSHDSALSQSKQSFCQKIFEKSSVLSEFKFYNSTGPWAENGFTVLCKVTVGIKMVPLRRQPFPQCSSNFHIARQAKNTLSYIDNNASSQIYSCTNPQYLFIKSDLGFFYFTKQSFLLNTETCFYLFLCSRI